MRAPYTVGFLVLAASLCMGCFADLRHEQEPVEEASLAFIEALLERDGQLLTELSQGPVDAATVDTVSGYVSGYQTADSAVLNYNIRQFNNGAPTATLLLEAPRHEQWMLVQLQLVKVDNRWKVADFRAEATAQSQAEANRFRLTGLTGGHWGFLFIIAVLGSFNVWTFYRYARGPKPRRWILWGIAILTGVGTLSLDWTTGEQGARLLHLHFPFFSAGRAIVTGPWLLHISFPVGAIMYWVFCDAWVDKPGPKPTTTAPAAPSSAVDGDSPT